ncbi:MAG: PhzF family phenazine biosynthesis isomerase [Alphaproteobacteria bacterium]|nr:PhzF family phenazine biosynthesis isomerase [Alphaproteobacteria bacterium]
MTTLPFATLDVFTDRRFAGNPLAVVWDADALNDQQMQAIAREFNLSETVFVRRPENPVHTAAVRVFTPGRELPFAGHPTVGTAVFLAERQHGRASNLDTIITLEERIGLVRCAVKINADGASFAEFDAPKLAEEIGPAASDAALAQALSLTPEDIGFDRHMPTLYSAGVTFAFAPVKTLAALARAKPSAGFTKDVLGVTEVYVYARLPEESPHAFRARMFAPEIGVVEDPATGSAAAAFAGVCARFEGLADGWHTLPIEQGVEMGRPSLIGLEIELAGGLLNAVRIGGKAIGVSEGRIWL